MANIGNSPGVASQRVVTTFTATAGQTLFVPNGGYTLGYCDVFLNGIKLVNGDDYTAANGINFTLTSGAAVGDAVECVAYFPRGLSDGYMKSEADAKYVAKAGSNMTGPLGIGVSNNTGKLDVLTYGSAFPVPAQGSIGGSAGTKVNVLGTEPGVICHTDLNFANGTQTGTATASAGVALGFYNVNDVRAQVFWAGNNVPLSFTNASSTTGSSVERMRIDGLGRVTTPYQPAFWSRASGGDLTLGAGAVTFFNSVVYNRGNCFNSANGTFTAPVAGAYMFCLGIFLNGGTEDRFGVAINGGGMTYPYVTSAKAGAQSGAVVVSLAANDTVNIFAQYGGATLYRDHCGFMGYLIG